MTTPQVKTQTQWYSVTSKQPHSDVENVAAGPFPTVREAYASCARLRRAYAGMVWEVVAVDPPGPVAAGVVGLALTAEQQRAVATALNGDMVVMPRALAESLVLAAMGLTDAGPVLARARVVLGTADLSALEV